MTNPTCEECPICVEPWNRSTRLWVNCAGCSFVACRMCYERYLLQESSAKCMSCAREMTRSELVSKFTKKFINTEYKAYREKYLFDQERSMLPATQTIVEQLLEREKVRTTIHILRAEIEERYQLIHRLEHDLNRRNPQVERRLFIRKCPNMDCRGFLSSQWKCNLCNRRTCKECNECIVDDEHKCNPDNVETAKLLAQDSKPCPTCGELIFKIDGCFAKDTPIRMWDGSTKYSQDIQVGDRLVGDDGQPRRVLDLCTGEDQMYQIDQTKGMRYIVNSKHTLLVQCTNQDNVLELSVEAYLQLAPEHRKHLHGFKRDKEETRMAIRVTSLGKGRYYGWQVDGNHRFLLEDFTVVRNCDQIFCTQCHTAFSWRTGRKETGTIHNPHYFEWLRQNNQEPQEFQVMCGREIDNFFIRRLTRYNLASSWLLNLCRNLIHFRAVKLPTFETHPFADNQDLRIAYLQKKLSEAVFQVTLQRREKMRLKKQDYYRLFTMMIQCMTDILYRYADEVEPLSDRNPRSAFSWMTSEFEQARTQKEETYCNEIFHLLQYGNECLKNIASVYNSQRYYLSDAFVLVNSSP